jgi:hypothetical protein
VKLARATLLTLLALTCVLQCVEGLASIANPAGMMAGLNLSMAPGVEVPLTFLGVSMIARGAVTAIAFAWIMRRKPEGVFLARFTALSILVSAPIVYVKLHRLDFVVGDLVQGLLLLLPALVVSENDRSN